MKYTILFVPVFFCAALLCAGQPSISNAEAAKKYSQELCSAFFAGNYGKFKAMLPESLLPKFNPVLYRVSLDELQKNGPCHLPMQYLGTLRRPGMLLMIWKIEYQGKNGELLDRLASTSFAVEDGHWTLTGFRFI